MQLSLFYIDTSRAGELTARQFEIVRHRIAQSFGARAEYSPLVYIMIMGSLYVAIPEAQQFFRSYWLLIALLFLVSLVRVSIAQRLSAAGEDKYKPYLVIGRKSRKLKRRASLATEISL